MEAILVMLRYYLVVETYQTFLGNSPNRTGMVVDTTVINRARLEAWVFSVV